MNRLSMPNRRDRHRIAEDQIGGAPCVVIVDWQAKFAQRVALLLRGSEQTPCGSQEYFADGDHRDHGGLPQPADVPGILIGWRKGDRDRRTLFGNQSGNPRQIVLRRDGERANR